jgi:hypothetical protein
MSTTTKSCGKQTHKKRSFESETNQTDLNPEIISKESATDTNNPTPKTRRARMLEIIQRL